MKKFISILFGFLILVFFAHGVFAEDVYKITDPMVIPPPSVRGVGRVIWNTSFTYDRHDAPVILSANPDRTGAMNVGDQVQIFVTYIGSLDTKMFSYNSSPDCKTRTPLQPTDMSNYFQWKGGYNVSIRILDWCGSTQNISSMYFVGGNPNPGPEPFLDLPWDYASHGLTFNDAALSMTSFFDHTYPLLSSGLAEPSNFQSQVTTFENEATTQKSYSSHDGYDYARLAGAVIGEPVLAAAAGTASYIDDCAACGNMIVIDHGNGYQTRYMHLQKEGLIIDRPGVNVPVNDRQVIGRVGATGNVIPAGESGAHIHFMVVEDKNHDGNFNDNIPDGVTDPFGWQSTQTDPWIGYDFTQNNVSKKGNKSFYLFKTPLAGVTKSVTPQGDIFVVSNYSFNFSPGTTSQTLGINIHASPVAKISNLITSIGPSVTAIAKDALGNIVINFDNAFKLEIKFGAFDISSYKSDSLSIYSSEDGTNWKKEPTTIDFSNKTATSYVDHFSHFALFGERKDSTVPFTTVTLDGEQGETNWFRSDVTMKFESQDNQDGVGVDYTLYKVNDAEWQLYTSPLKFSKEGHYKVAYYSIDRDDNAEDVKYLEFDIDKQTPEIAMQYDPHIQDILFAGNDEHIVTLKQNQSNQNMDEIVASDQAGNRVSMVLREKVGGKNARLSIKSLVYNSQNIQILPDNIFTVSYRLEEQNQEQRKLEQGFRVSGNPTIKLIYKLSTDKTSVLIDNAITQELSGIKLLQISTKNGTLIYTY